MNELHCYIITVRYLTKDQTVTPVTRIH